MIIHLGQFSSVNKNPPEYTYTGTSKYTDEGNGNWHLELLTSGILTFTKLNNAKKTEGFFVGPGTRGDTGRNRTDADRGRGGNGGNGGELKTVKGIRFEANKPYQVDIGAPGNPTQITVDGVVITGERDVQCIAKSGAGKAGGLGAEGAETARAGLNGEYPFGDASYGKRYGASGGGGSTDQGTPAEGGKDGAGHGGRGEQNYEQTETTPNSGSGGGGGGAGWYASGTGSAGATGAGFLRNSRK